MGIFLLPINCFFFKYFFLFHTFLAVTGQSFGFQDAIYPIKREVDTKPVKVDEDFNSTAVPTEQLINALSSKSELSDGKYSLSSAYQGTVKTKLKLGLGSNKRSNNTLTALFKDWPLTIDRAMVSAEGVFLLPSRETGSVGPPATLLKNIPDIEKLATIKTMKEFEQLLGPPREQRFRDVHFIEDSGVMIFESWVVCSIEENSIRYVNIKLFLQGPSFDQLEIVDRWIQEATLTRQSEMNDGKEQD